MITSAGLVLLLLQARSLPRCSRSSSSTRSSPSSIAPPPARVIADLVPRTSRRRVRVQSAAVQPGVRDRSRDRRAPRRGALHAAVHRRRRDLRGVRCDLAGGAPHGTRTTKRQDRESGGARAAIFADRGFLLVLAAILAGGLVYAQGYSTFPLWVRDLGFPDRVYGFLQGSNGILVAIFELGVTAIAMRHPRIRMIALGVLLTGLGFGGFGILTSGIGMAIAVAVWSFGEMFGSPSSAAFIADRAPAHLRGRYQSSLGITYALAFTIGPVGGTALYSVWPKGLWITCAALGVIGAALALAAQRYPAPTVAVPPPG